MPTAGAEGERLDDVAPERTPESNSTACRRRPPRRQAVERGQAAVGLAPAVVGAVDRRRRRRRSRGGRRRGGRCLQDQRQLGERPQPGRSSQVERVAEHTRPVHDGRRRVVARVAGRAGRGTGGRRSSWPGSARAAEGSCRWPRSRGRQPAIQVSSVTTMPVKPGRLGAVDEALGELAVVGRVELEEAGGGAELRGDGLHRIDGERRGDHRHAGAGAAARAVARSPWPSCAHMPMYADRRHEHRRWAACMPNSSTDRSRLVVPTSIRGIRPHC